MLTLHTTYTRVSALSYVAAIKPPGFCITQSIQCVCDSSACIHAILPSFLWRRTNYLCVSILVQCNVVFLAKRSCLSAHYHSLFDLALFNPPISFPGSAGSSVRIRQPEPSTHPPRPRFCTNPTTKSMAAPTAAAATGSKSPSRGSHSFWPRRKGRTRIAKGQTRSPESSVYESHINTCTE